MEESSMFMVSGSSTESKSISGNIKGSSSLGTRILKISGAITRIQNVFNQGFISYNVLNRIWATLCMQNKITEFSLCDKKYVLALV